MQPFDDDSREDLSGFHEVEEGDDNDAFLDDAPVSEPDLGDDHVELGVGEELDPDDDGISSGPKIADVDEDEFDEVEHAEKVYLSEMSDMSGVELHDDDGDAEY